MAGLWTITNSCNNNWQVAKGNVVLTFTTLARIRKEGETAIKAIKQRTSKSLIATY
jgi:hypothetical protein